MAKEASSGAKATRAITDGNQRRDVSFGGIRDNESYLLGPGQTAIEVPPGVPRAFIVVPGIQHETVAAPIGAVSTSASSFGSTLLLNTSSDGPASAFDSDPKSSWVASAKNDSIGQWISITFKHPVNLSTIYVTPLVGTSAQPTVSRVTISTQKGSVSRYLPATSHQVRLTVASGSSKYLKVTIDAVRPVEQTPGGIVLGAGITHISIPGVSFQESMKVPDDEAAAFAGRNRNSQVIAFSRPLTNANLSLGSSNTDDPYMARAFHIPKSMNAVISGYAVPVPGQELEQTLDTFPQTFGPLQISASSWLGSLPRFRPENLIDHSGAPWIAGTADRHPTIVLRFSKPTIVSSILLQPTQLASRPAEVSIVSSSGDRPDLKVSDGGLVTFRPLITTTLTIRFVKFTQILSLSPLSGVAMTMPVGLAAVSVAGLHADAVIPRYPAAPVKFGCGQGPAVIVDGQSVKTTATGTLSNLLDLTPLKFTTCTSTVHLAAGTHVIESQLASSSKSLFEITSLVASDPSQVQSTSKLDHRIARVESWSTTSRSVAVTSGPATYLVLAQNYNAGWVATLAGRRLPPIRIDGWQQGYLIPAGSAGVVSLSMASDRLFRILLVLGALFLVVLVALALFPSRRVERDPCEPRRLPNHWLLLTAEAIILLLIGGPLFLVALPMLFLARRWGGDLMAVISFAAFLVGGIAAAWQPAAVDTASSGALGPVAQVAAVTALAALLSAVTVESRNRKRHDGADEHQLRL